MTTLSTLTTRVQAALMDTGAKVWSAGTIEEDIRLAVGEYGLAGTSAVTVSGLDGAAETTLNPLHESVIVWGAAAYAALSRTVDRADSYQLSGDPAALKAWGDARLREFKGMLGFVFPGYLAALRGTEAGGGSAEDPGKLAAEISLLGQQSALAEAQSLATRGQESRAAAAAAQAAQDRAAEAARLNELRTESANAPWGRWAGAEGIDYPDGYDRN